MGYLWENMEKIDVQGTYEALTQTRTELSDTKEELSDTKEELSNTKKKLVVAENRAQNAEAENAHLKALLAEYGIKYTKK